MAIRQSNKQLLISVTSATPRQGVPKPGVGVISRWGRKQVMGSVGSLRYGNNECTKHLRFDKPC